MPHESVEFMRALLSAYEGRVLYGPKHSGSVRALARAAEALAAALSHESAVTVALAADGLLLDTLLVTDAWATTSAFAVHLAAAGVQAARFLQGSDAADLAWLLESIEKRQGCSSPSGRVILARVTIELPTGVVGGPGACAPRSPGAESVDSLRGAWAAALAGGNAATAAVAPIAANITSAVLDNRTTLLQLIDLKNHNEYTYVHTTNVAILSSALAQIVGLNGDQVHQITEAALLHDIGKWKLPNALLDKAARLSDAERETMQQHPSYGAAILASLPGVSDLSIVVAFEHHQRIDGGGYPRLPRGHYPSLLSQIVQVADIFDALRSNRPYRAALPTEECLSILADQAGKSFDRDLFVIFRDRIIRRVPAPPSATPPAPAVAPVEPPPQAPPAAAA